MPDAGGSYTEVTRQGWLSRIGGSIKGEDSQNAMTADSGAPTASSPAMKGMTSQEQKGASPPNSAANRIMRVSLPSNARATKASAPLAFNQAISTTAITIYGNVLNSAPAASTKR